MVYRLIISISIVFIASIAIMFEPRLTLTQTHESAQAAAVLNFVSPTPTVSSANATPTSKISHATIDISDPTIFAAIISAIVSVVIACAGGVGILHGHGLQKKLLRYQKELDMQYEVKQQEEQRKTANLDVIRREALLAKNNAERAEAYCRGLRADPRISWLQILDMSRPLEIANVYIRVLIHEEARPRYEIDPLLRNAEMDHDPKKMLQASRTYLERRASAALSPEEAIRKYRCCVIVGDPGAGKTTLLKFLTLKSSENALKDLPNLPLYIELNHFATQTEHRSLLDFAANLWDERYGFMKEDARAYLEEMLKAGKVLVLLDALDETIIGEQTEAAEASYQRATNAILQVTTLYPRSPIVVTARKAGYQQRMPLPGFTEFEVVDFRLEDMQKFVTKWFTSSDDPQKQMKASDLNTKLSRHERIQAIASTPLLLTLIVLVYQAQLDLPDRRTDLYKRCIDVLLREWDAKRHIRRRQEFKPEHKQQLLTEVAWYFHTQGKRFFPKRELLTVIAGFLPVVGLPPEEHERVLEEIANENGLLKEQAHGWYSFLHLTLQEYFVAQYVNDHNELTFLSAHLDEPWWEEVLLLYAGQTYDASPLLSQLLGHTAQQDDIFHTRLLAAGHCLAASPMIRQIPLRDEVITRLFELLTGTDYSLLRKRVAKTLAEIGGPRVNSRLIDLLSNQQTSRDVCLHIARALGEVGDRSVAPDLVRLLDKQPIDLNVRWSIADALGSLGELSIIPDLIHLLDNQQVHLSVRRNVANAMGILGDQSVMPELRYLLDNQHVDLTVRWSIAAALGSLGDQSVISELRLLICEKQVSIDFRIHAANALLALGERSVVSDLLQLLNNQQVDLIVRWSIAKTIGALGERSAVPELLRLLDSKQVDKDVRIRIATALGTLGDPSVVPELLCLLDNQQVDKDVRRSIADTLGVLGDRSVIPDLLHLLDNPNIDLAVHWSIIATLGTLGEPSVIPKLLQLLNSQQADWNVRIRIAEALGSLAQDDSTIQEIMKLLQTSDLSDVIYDTLWSISQHAGVKIFVCDTGPEIVHL